MIDDAIAPVPQAYVSLYPPFVRPHINSVGADSFHHVDVRSVWKQPFIITYFARKFFILECSDFVDRVSEKNGMRQTNQEGVNDFAPSGIGNLLYFFNLIRRKCYFDGRIIDDR